MANNDNSAKKIGKSFFSMFKRLFVRDKAGENVLEEEALRTPGKTILLNLLHNKLAMIGTCVFVAVLLFCFVGSTLFPVPLNYNEYTNANLKPGANYLKYPQNELRGKNIVKIVSGVSFSIALDDQGDLYIWGTEPNLELRSVSDYILKIPEEVKRARIVDIEAGGTHIICIDDQNNFYGWGHYGHGQTKMPFDVASTFSGPDVSIVKMGAMKPWTALLGSDGNLYVWGSMQSVTNLTVPAEYQGRIVDFVAADNNMVLLLDDGSVGIIGLAGTEFYQQVPQALQDGSVNLVSIAATNRNVLALDDQGELYLWGNMENGLNTLPEFTGRPVHIDAGYKNFVIVTDDGSVVTWGANELGQLELPRNLAGTTKVFADYFQFYAIGADGQMIDAWGNNGYLWGTDQFGRDMFIRLMYGGKISLTVGFLAVVIATFIAIIIGLISGFFGGWVDHLLMRLTDIFSSIPFIPIAITLSYAIGHNMTADQKLYLIMVVLGVLSWMSLARLIRAQLLLEREKDFVLAAKSLGIKQRNIMLRHILPNVVNHIIVNVTLSYASFMLTEAALSFLGFGVAEPVPSWGNMLTSAQESMVIQYYWWRWVIPAVFVVIGALSINMLGDALREAMDPRANER